MTPQWFRDLDEKSAGLFKAVDVVCRIMRQSADNPDQAEGDLREHLRMGARLLEKLGESNKVLIEFNRQSVVRFVYLSAVFTLLLIWNVVNVFF